MSYRILDLKSSERDLLIPCPICKKIPTQIHEYTCLTQEYKVFCEENKTLSCYRKIRMKRKNFYIRWESTRKEAVERWNTEIKKPTEKVQKDE